MSLPKSQRTKNYSSLTGWFLSCLILFLGSLLSFSGTAQTKGIELSDAPQTSFSGKTFAVIVGIDNYKAANMPQLNYAVSDARAFEEFLRSKAGGQVPSENIKLFVNDSATTGRFKKLGLSWVKNAARKGDRVYLYFSGHGLTVSGGDSYFLASNLSPDFDIVNIEEAGTQALYQLKTNTIRPLHDSGVQVILIMDACRSFLEKNARSTQFTSFNPNVKSAEMKAGDYMFLSSSNGQASTETAHDNMRHGIFTYYLLSGLYGMADNGRNADGKITFNKLKNYITQKVSDYSNETQIPIIEKSDEGNPTLALVDSFLLARQIKAEQGSLSGSLAVNRSRFGTGKSFNSTHRNSDTSQAYSLFMEAVGAGRIWGDDGSVHFFDQLEQRSGNPELLKDAVLNLSALLIDSGQTIINAYIQGDDESLAKIGAVNTGNALDTVFLKGAMLFDVLYRYYSKYYPEDPDCKTYLQHFYFMMGRSLVHDRESQKNSLEYLENAYKLNTQSLYILHAIDMVLSEIPERKKEALENERRVVAKYGQWAFALKLLGNLYKDMGQMDSALYFFKRSVSASPNDFVNFTTHITIAECYDQLYRFDLAENHLDTAKIILKKQLTNPASYYNNWEVYINLVDLTLNSLEQQDSAHLYSTQVFKALPETLTSKIADESTVLRNLLGFGDLYVNYFKQFDTAFYFYTRANKLRPNKAETLRRLGFCHHKMRHPDAASSAFLQALNVAEDGEQKDNVWSSFGDYYLEEKNTDSALYCYKKIKSDSIQYLFSMGSCFLNLDRTDSATTYLERGLDHLSNSYMNNSNLNRDLSGLVQSCMEYCSGSNIPSEWTSRQLDKLFGMFTEQKNRNPSTWASLAKALDKANHNKADSAYMFLNEILCKNVYFDSSSADDWYGSPVCFYIKKRLPEQRMIPFLEKAVALNPAAGNHKALELLNRIRNNSRPKKRT